MAVAIGDTFGSRTVIGFEHVDSKHGIRARCRCQCGSELLVIPANLVRGHQAKCRDCEDRARKAAAEANASTRFWSKVKLSGQVPAHMPEIGECWLWTGGTARGGYGCTWFRGAFRRANRVAWLLEYGEIPEGMLVCHTCDNPPCVRPSHLWLGTTRDNAIDMARKGRHSSVVHPERVARGERHSSRTRPESIPRGDSHHARKHPERMARGARNGRALLSEAQVLEIRQKAQRMTGAALAREYGISPTTMSLLLNGYTWRHVVLEQPNEPTHPSHALCRRALREMGEMGE